MLAVPWLSSTIVVLDSSLFKACTVLDNKISLTGCFVVWTAWEFGQAEAGLRWLE